MRLPFNGDFPLTQGFGLNKDRYQQFGLLGHNGLDFGLPTGTEVVAPHSGVVLEVADEEAGGYGKYIKIENSAEGSVLAHLHDEAVVVGSVVSEGQLLGHSNNTGNSTGPHLHWGYYTLPRDRNNGFAGFIDQSSLINNQSSGETVKVTIEGGLRARTTPHVNATNIIRGITQGASVAVDGFIKGDNENGNDLWWKLAGEEAYIWSGGTDKQPIENTPVSTPQATGISVASTSAPITGTDTINDQTKLPIIDENGNQMEVQAVRSRLSDQQKQIDNQSARIIVLEQGQPNVDEITKERDDAVNKLNQLQDFFISLHSSLGKAIETPADPNANLVTPKKSSLNIDWLLAAFHLK